MAQRRVRAVSPAEEPVTVGLDVGTASARAYAVTRDGRVAGAGSRPLRSHRQRGRHEQDPADWWEAAAGACRDALAGVAAERVRAVATCATSGTALLAGRDGRPLTPGLMYDDGRAAAQARRLGMSPSWALPKLLWLLEHAGAPPGARAALAPDVVNGRLAGHRVASDASHALKAGYVPSAGEPDGEAARDRDGNAGVSRDRPARGWPGAVVEALEAHGGLPLPAVVASGARLGVVCAHASSATGLPAGTPIVAGMTDGCAAQIAAGALRPGDLSSVLGTTLVVKGCSRERVVDRAAGVYSHRAPGGGWLPGGASSTGAGILPLTFPGADLGELGRRAVACERTTVLAYPLATRGERFPFTAPAAEGFLLGAPASEAEHAAALLQGVALVERLCVERLARLGVPVGGELSLTGGATRNRHWCQLRADALRRCVRLPEHSESAVGMAILAAAAVDGEPLAQAARRMSQTAQVIDPREALAAHLDAQYARLCDELERRGWLS